MDEKLDRRTKRTKIALKNHFMELLKIKPIQKITVTELCDMVDINRSTFYKHYFDLYALLEDIEKDFYHQIDLLMEDIIAQPLKPQHVSRRILQYICLFTKIMERTSGTKSMKKFFICSEKKRSKLILFQTILHRLNLRIPFFL